MCAPSIDCGQCRLNCARTDRCYLGEEATYIVLPSEFGNMFCLRSWLPLLFIPTNASPMFIMIFFLCTYFLNRPCVYCSFLLIILFASSCQWSDHCFFDFSSNWFEPRTLLTTSQSSPTCSNWTSLNETRISKAMESTMVYAGALNQTASTLGGVAFEELKRRFPAHGEWTGVGVGWMRSLLGQNEWRLPCFDVYVRL